MMGFFRRGGERRRVIASLHAAVTAAARRPGLYTELGVPDTVEGRFESLCLHVYLVLRRLDRLPPPAPEVAQEFVDSVFAELDASLRELGVSDMGVGKRMKKLGAAFYGRAAGYDAALKAPGDEALRQALARDFDIPAVRDLVGRFVLSGSLSRLTVTGTVEAVATQVCTVTLEPFEARLREPVEVVFSDAPPPEEDEEGTPENAPEPPDPIVNGRIDLGALTAEFLALGLDPYPRKPGVDFEPVASGPESGPFDALRRLRDEEA